MNAHTHKLTQDLFTNQHTAHHLCDLSTAQRGRDSEGLRHTHTSTSVHIQADRQKATYTHAHTRVCTPACTHAHRQTDRNSVCLSDRQKLCRRTLSVCLSVCLSDLRALPLSPSQASEEWRAREAERERERVYGREFERD